MTCNPRWAGLFEPSEGSEFDLEDKKYKHSGRKRKREREGGEGGGKGGMGLISAVSVFVSA